jgi:hypothetical protein
MSVAAGRQAAVGLSEMSTFWIGGKEQGNQDPSVETSQGACEHVLKALGKEPGASGSIPAAVAGSRLRKYDFPDATVSDAAGVLKLVKGATGGGGIKFGVVLRWRA